MNLHQCIFVNSDCYKRGVYIVPRGVMWHSTGADNPQLKRYVQPDDGLLGYNSYQNHWNRNGLNVCVHAFIGKLQSGEVATYQTLPWNRRGWHAGGKANDTHISFEICEDGLDDEAYFREVYREAVELTAELCKEYGLDPMEDGVVIDHKEGHDRGLASNHGDITHWLKIYGLTMDDVRRDVATEMAKDEEVEAVAEVKRYQTLEELPAWAVPEATELVELGALRGNEKGLDVTEDMLRCMIINLRATKALLLEK